MTRGTPIAQEISFGIPKKKAKAKTKKAKGKGFLGALKEQAEKDSRKPDFNSAEFNHGALGHACARPLRAAHADGASVHSNPPGSRAQK